MNKQRALLFTLLLFCITSLFADNFITLFLEKYADEKHVLNNVNIGSSMLDKMAANTQDKELKNIFRNLKSIRIITSEDKIDSQYYFQKAKELIQDETFSDFKEVVTLNERKAKVNVLLKNIDDKTQELILIGLDSENKLTIITVNGKIDFKSISKLSSTLNGSEDEMTTDGNEKNPPTDVSKSEE